MTTKCIQKFDQTGNVIQTLRNVSTSGLGPSQAQEIHKLIHKPISTKQ